MKRTFRTLVAASVLITCLVVATTASASTVTVQANAYPGVDTGVAFQAGTTYVVTATGTWSVGGSYGTYDANGATTTPNMESCSRVPSAPMGMLVGSLDGGATWFAVGAGPTRLTGSGELILAANDCSGPGGVYYSDNSGSLSVQITPALPTSKDQCKDGGWQSYGIFKNQGDCVSFVATKGKNPANG